MRLYQDLRPGHSFIGEISGQLFLLIGVTEDPQVEGGRLHGRWLHLHYVISNPRNHGTTLWTDKRWSSAVIVDEFTQSIAG